MSEPFEEAYFNWLCAKVRRTSFPLYLDLLRILYTTEFVPRVDGDENRAEDGKELREDFVRESGYGWNPDWDHEECSILELIVAFSVRASFQTGMPSRDWFWRMIDNLGLGELRQMQATDIRMVRLVLDKFNARSYSYSGHGGLFPLRWPQEDQREVEIWVQFCMYVEEEQLV